MKIKEIIVVEGKADTVKIKQALKADTIETNGSAINKQTLKKIKHAQKRRGVIVFTDPDYAGERIRHIINAEVPGCKHAFLPRHQAKSKKDTKASIGIEHATTEAIQEALRGVYEVFEQQTSSITKGDLIQSGLIGKSGAHVRRKRLGEILQIGQPNGKQLLKRLEMFNITKEQFDWALQQIRREEENE